MMKKSLIAGNSLELTNYNVVGNDGRECLKIVRLDNQQLNTAQGGSSTASRKAYHQVMGNGIPLNKGEDMVSSSVKAEAVKGQTDKFYTYMFFDATQEGDYKAGGFQFKFKPIYVGKGKNNRWTMHFKTGELTRKSHLLFYKKLSSMLFNNNMPLIIKIGENLSEQEAFALEVDVIKAFGRIGNNGILYNLTDGGDGSSGFAFREESKQKLRDFYKRTGKVNGSKNPSYGNGWRVSGSKNGMFGKKVSEEAKAKVRAKLLGWSNPKDGKDYQVRFPNGETIVIKGLSRFCKQAGLTYNASRDAALKGRIHKGYKFTRI